MAEGFNFEKALQEALDEKVAWFDSNVMADMLDNYRVLYSASNNVMGLLLQKGLITPDPYKLDKKISDIVVPEDGEFPENTRSQVMGVRLSDYERVLDFLCNYFKFSAVNLTLPRIKKLINLNNYIQWGGLAVTSKHPNTKALADLLTNIRQGTDTMATGSINGAVSAASRAILDINNGLKASSELQRELYKMEVRKNVIAHSSFTWEKGEAIPDVVQRVKKLFPSTMGRQPFYPELVEEIAQESIGVASIQKQQDLLARLKVVQQTKAKKKVQLNTKTLIMDAVRNLAGMAPQLEGVSMKLRDNSALLQTQYDTPWEKFKRAFRKAFGLKPPVIEYAIPMADAMTKTSTTEKVNFNKSLGEIAKRMNLYEALASRESPTYQKMEAQEEEEIYTFLTKQLAECQQMLLMLLGYDKFFKNEVASPNKAKVKGLTMETTSIKNTMVKTNQRKAEYAAYVEEQKQLKRLGIIDEE
ncbi:MAG: hypothetical protein J6R96_05340 [Spirochaetaceae bacterium]|nr:hypothetical protein [Spirochaetaceae bacterium]